MFACVHESIHRSHHTCTQVSTLISILEGFLSDESSNSSNSTATAATAAATGGPASSSSSSAQQAAPTTTTATAALTLIPPDRKTPDVLESVFIYAAVWAFGGAMGADKQVGTHMGGWCVCVWRGGQDGKAKTTKHTTPNA